MSNHINIKIPKLQDTLLVSFARENPSSNPIVIIGRKRMNESIDIINAFEGKEALDIYEKLTTVNKKEGTENG